MRTERFFIAVAFTTACAANVEPVSSDDNDSVEPISQSNRDDISEIDSGVSALGAARSDTQPPTVPRNLRVTGTRPNSVSLAWDPSTDDSGSLFYTIVEDNNPDLMVDVYQASATIAPLPAATTFGFRVRARDFSQNASALSNRVTVTTDPPDVTPPTTPRNLRVTGTAAETVFFAWDPSTDDWGRVGYRLYQDGVWTVGTTETRLTYRLPPGATHRFYVTAVDVAYPNPNESPPSNEVTAATSGR